VLLGTFAPGFDVTGTINRSIVEDETTMLIDWSELPGGDGDVSFAVLFGEHTEDTSGYSAAEFDALHAERLGGGIFQPLESSPAAGGPPWVFENGIRVGDRVVAGPATLPIQLELPILGFVEVSLLGATLDMDPNPSTDNPPEPSSAALQLVCLLAVGGVHT